MSVEEILRDIRKSNVTSTIHETPYAAISPTRPELSQKGRAVLITGGGTGAGFAMARAFVRASASTVIIIGRRAGILEAAKGKLEEEAKTTATYSNIRIKACDVLNFQEVDKLWKELEDEVVGGVDVYVANAAKFTEPQPMFELGVEEVWSQVETNVKSPLYFAEKFWKQPGTGEKQKVSSILSVPNSLLSLPLNMSD
jgi:NAD(P)-dependent dehydrogenase (short-subunit alcohol dehydrogenase family)